MFLFRCFPDTFDELGSRFREMDRPYCVTRGVEFSLELRSSSYYCDRSLPVDYIEDCCYARTKVKLYVTMTTGVSVFAR
jgi:hypothetical protein